MMHWSDGAVTGFGGGFFGGLLMLTVVALAVVGVVALVRDWQRGEVGFLRRSPQQILDERFARGEMDIEEYTRRRGLLQPRE
jgi:putative membrane protein